MMTLTSLFLRMKMKIQERKSLDTYNYYLAEHGEQREIYTIPSTELDNILCKFLVGARQKNGQEYEPSYLRGMLSSYERHLKKTDMGTALIKIMNFLEQERFLNVSKKILKHKAKAIYQSGLIQLMIIMTLPYCM